MVLHENILKTSEPLGELGVSHARLQTEADYPWIVLIPRFENCLEFDDVPADLRAVVLDEMFAAGHAVRAVGEALGRPVHKLNLGSLGNMTPQLHIHVTGRRHDDPLWPAPVWGRPPGRAYSDEALALAITTAQRALGL